MGEWTPFSKVTDGPHCFRVRLVVLLLLPTTTLAVVGVPDSRPAGTRMALLSWNW